VELLSSSTAEKETKDKLEIIKGQLEVINSHLHSLRDLNEFKTVDFSGITLLDLDPSKDERDT
jgi:hypothetical protein